VCCQGDAEGRKNDRFGPRYKTGERMNKQLLSVDNLRIEFTTRHGTLVAVNDISFKVNSGEIFGIIGESGAGKSLTGQAIIGLLEPPGKIGAGKIKLNDRRIDNLPYQQMRKIRGKEIGMIFQDPLTSLNPLYTIGRQLIETIQTHTEMTVTQAREHAINLLEEVGIPAAGQRIDHYPYQFSGGMRQRVVIALALCVNPLLIIADEPTTALDVSIQAQIIALLKKLCKDYGTAVILITHDMGVIAEAADRVAVMYAGRLVEIGQVRQVVKRAVHPYTKGLMKAIPSLNQRAKKLNQIDGSMPRLSDIPKGCAFHPRCPECVDMCKEKQPDLIDIGAAQVACWRYHDIKR